MSERNSAARCRLVLLRHGQSEWNARNLFTGWANPDLTAAGEREAVHAGQLLAAHHLLPDALIKHLDAIGDDEVTALNVPNGVPLVYHLRSDMRPLTKGGRYLGRQTGGTGAATPAARAG